MYSRLRKMGFSACISVAYPWLYHSILVMVFVDWLGDYLLGGKVDGLTGWWMNEWLLSEIVNEWLVSWWLLSEIVNIINLEKGKWKVTVESAVEKKIYYF